MLTGAGAAPGRSIHAQQPPSNLAPSTRIDRLTDAALTHGAEVTDLARQFDPVRAGTLDNVADDLNGRPRQALDWMEPSEAFDQLVAMTT